MATSRLPSRRNHGTKGDFFTASSPTIRYKDEKTAEWKDGNSYDRQDLPNLAEAAREPALKILDLQKSKG